jgi:hypothetical protein
MSNMVVVWEVPQGVPITPTLPETVVPIWVATNVPEGQQHADLSHWLLSMEYVPDHGVKAGGDDGVQEELVGPPVQLSEGPIPEVSWH